MRRLLLSLGLFACLSLAFGSLAYAGYAELNATILRVIEGSPTKLKLAAGTDKKVSAGTQGYLVDEQGRHIPGGDIKVTSAEAKSCIAETSLPAGKIDGSFGAILQVP
jgi:hypothetical protein